MTILHQNYYTQTAYTNTEFCLFALLEKPSQNVLIKFKYKRKMIDSKYQRVNAMRQVDVIYPALVLTR